VGGTGKTPTVQFLVQKFIDEGRKVAIVSRGYKGKRKHDPMIVSDGKTILATAKESGDEPLLHALNTKVPIVVGKDRYSACIMAKENFDIDTIVLDDGFQHRKLKRDCNIVLIDATNPFGGGRLLPLGTLREDLKQLKRANEFIITKADLADDREIKKIKKYLSRYKKNISVAKYGVVSLKDLKGDRKPLFWINKKKVLLFSGLANPLNFEKTVISLMPSATDRVDFLDHHSFTEKDFKKIIKRANEMGADFIITTEKDIVKLPQNFKMPKTYVLKIELTMIEDNLLKSRRN
jgi:tetraacyldisaccharide 4'-kinase